MKSTLTMGDIENTPGLVMMMTDLPNLSSHTSVTYLTRKFCISSIIDMVLCGLTPVCAHIIINTHFIWVICKISLLAEAKPCWCPFAGVQDTILLCTRGTAKGGGADW